MCWGTSNVFIKSVLTAYVVLQLHPLLIYWQTNRGKFIEALNSAYHYSLLDQNWNDVCNIEFKRECFVARKCQEMHEITLVSVPAVRHNLLGY